MATSKKGVEVGRVFNTAKLEKDIQREICEWLEDNKYFFWRSNNIPVFGRSRDGGTMAFRRMSKYTPKGVPDILVVHNGDFIGLEVKRAKALLRPEQVAFGLKMYANGAYYRRVSSVEDVYSLMKDVKSHSTIY